eukprot:TRINITY_DN9551_c0_g1_i1.p1 TRINITY_DN9551_c0_g1~~TRINITY_DN9551_c0_g1_i1.p1  ORF type:complete len:552 (-),score=98.82 TRINITY_DN9551_c0_g1_i1:83-1738(-)
MIKFWERLQSLETLTQLHAGNEADSWWKLVFTAVLALFLMAVLMDWMVFGDTGQLSGLPPVQWRTKSDRRSLRRLALPADSVKLAAVAEEPTKTPDRTEMIRQRMNKAMLAIMAARTWDGLEVDHTVLRSAASDCRPCLVFVNTRSGGQQGMKVLIELRAILHSVQVVDLQKEGPEAALSWWSKTGLKYRILVCGGDGTVGWLLGVLEELQLEYVPPIAILPLGTGNDLARVLGWGGGFTGGSMLAWLQLVDNAHVELLDRWVVQCTDSASSASSLRRPSFLPALQQSRERKTMSMCNYFGIGVDAAVALDFHQMRERSPHLFVSCLVNKLWYFRSGTKAMFQNTCANIGSKVTLECDGAAVDIPQNLEGIIVLNIPSFGGGTDLWGQAHAAHEDDEDGVDSDSSMCMEDSIIPDHLQSLRQSKQDGKLEVVGVHGVLQLGASQVGLYKAQRLAQGSCVKLANKVPLPVEVDGEPWWFASDGEIEISLKSQAFVLARNTASSHAAFATDVVDSALQRDIITVAQRDQLFKDIAHRSQTSRRFGSFPKLAFD